MNRLHVFTSVLTLCATVVVFAGDTEDAENGSIRGVIASERAATKWRVQVAQAKGFWTPTPQDVEAAESRLRAALEKGAKDPDTIMPGPFSDFSRKYSSGEIAKVLEHYITYRRQYVGVIVGGKRYLLLNSFPARESMHERERFVSVDDGGSNFWRVLYSIDDKTFSRMEINGYA